MITRLARVGFIAQSIIVFKAVLIPRLTICFPARLALLLGIISFGLRASIAQSSPTFQSLNRGVNASNWLAAHGPGSIRMTADDVPELKKNLDVDFLRLLVDPTRPLVCDPQKPSHPLLPLSPTEELGSSGVIQLDCAVKAILANGLKVVIAIDPDDEYRSHLTTSVNSYKAGSCLIPYRGQAQTAEQIRSEFCALWKALARHYASYAGDRVFFEILNEPRLADNELSRWAAYQNELIGLINDQASGHWIIATPGGGYSGIEDLMKFTPEPAPPGAKVVYTFHYYFPNEFAQEGKYSYPVTTPRNEKPDTGGLALEDAYLHNQYNLDQWDGTRISSQIFFAHVWSTKYNLPVWCGEFGVNKTGKDTHNDSAWQRARVNWLRDVRRALEQNRIGWTVWDYNTGDYGIVTGADPDEGIPYALFSH